MTLSLDEMKANRKLWVEALRSGKYEQAKGNLRDEDGYCCLGVLAVVAGESLKPFEYATLMDLPDVMAFVGLSDDAGVFGGDSLASKNDRGSSFPEIADIIEREPKGLFIESLRP